MSYRIIKSHPEPENSEAKKEYQQILAGIEPFFPCGGAVCPIEEAKEADRTSIPDLINRAIGFIRKFGYKKTPNGPD